MENAAAFAASGVAVGLAMFLVQGYPGGGMRVLVVEEDPAYLATLTQTLQSQGYQVTAKTSPGEGLRTLQENPEGFDLVMTVVRTQMPGVDGFELLRHAAERCPVVMFSNFEPTATMMKVRDVVFLTKPMREEEVRDVWQRVIRRGLSADSGASVAVPVPDTRSSDVVVRQDGTAARKRGAARLDDSGEGASGGSSQRRRNRGRTTKRTRSNSPLDPDVHAAVVTAAEQLRGTEDYCARGIRGLLEVQGVQLTMDKVERHMEKYRGECLTDDDLSAMPMASSSHSDIWKKNYSTPGSSGLYMGPQVAANINQTNLLSNGASPLGNEIYRASHVGHLYNNGNHHGDANGNCRGKYGNGYDYQYGNGNFNDNATANGYDCQNGNGLLATGSMVNASLPSNPARQVHQATPEGYGNGLGGLSASGSMVPSNYLAQPVQHAMPTNSMTRTMDDNPNPTEQQELPRISQLRYDSITGGISMSPWPAVTVDDGEGEELLRSYLQGQGDNEVMVIQSTAPADMTKGIHGDAAAGQISPPQPQNLTDPLSPVSTNESGTADTSGGSDVATEGNGDCEISFDELEKFLASREYLELDNGTAGTLGGSGVVTDGIVDRELSADELEKLLASREYLELDNGTAGTLGGSGVVTDGIVDRELSADELDKLLASREYLEWVQW